MNQNIQTKSNLKETFYNNLKLDFISNNFSYILFLSFFLILYIANGHRANRMLRNTTQINREAKKLHYEFLIYKKELTELTQQSKILEQMKKTNLKPLTSRPIILNNSDEITE